MALACFRRPSPPRRGRRSLSPRPGPLLAVAPLHSGGAALPAGRPHAGARPEEGSVHSLCVCTCLASFVLDTRTGFAVCEICIKHFSITYGQVAMAWIGICNEHLLALASNTYAMLMLMSCLSEVQGNRMTSGGRLSAAAAGPHPTAPLTGTPLVTRGVLALDLCLTDVMTVYLH
eukprot:scaffold41076_cov35-Prasinocladus_malaysianus.AAC.1